MLALVGTFVAVPDVDYYFPFGGLYSVYVRGEACLAPQQGAGAGAEFQEISLIAESFSAIPLERWAYLQLGRANLPSGDKLRTRSAYQAFLVLGKDADSDVPILRRAKAEYTKLR